MIKKYYNFIKKYIEINLQTAMEYKTNFILQSTFMILNNTLFVIFWYFLFQNIDNINGWRLNNLMLLFGLSALSYGFLSFFLGNWLRIHKIIYDGELDFYLSLPKNELLHLLISKSNFSGFGDILFGMIIFFITQDINFTNILLFMLFSITGAIILLSLIIIISSLTFFFGNSEGVFYMFQNLILSFVTYPYNVFSEIMKIIFLFIIPVFFISNIPIEILRQFSLKLFIEVIIVTILVFIIALFIFKKGLKKYESGNLINVRI